MSAIDKFLKIRVADQQQSAYIECTENYDKNLFQTDETRLLNFIKSKKIIYGINKKVLKTIIEGPAKDKFPFKIAEGKPPINGQDGTITFEKNFSPLVQKSVNWNFRDVMHIPSVKKGDQLATITLPTSGKNGMTVYGTVIQARQGKPVRMRAGKNVVFDEKSLAFYATEDGQVRMTKKAIEIDEVFEVHGSISMKTGNLNFIGSIIIHGDVPSGYSVRAKGDIKVFGIVEAALIEAEGSVYISEGFAGLKKGKIQAGKDIHVGYINQGHAHANDCIYVENSIIHSEISARNEIYCQKGNIIGGSVSAGHLIEAQDIGNRMSTKTYIHLGKDRRIEAQRERLLKEKQQLKDTLNKLVILGKKLNEAVYDKDPKFRITRLRQKHSYQKTKEQLQNIEKTLQSLDGDLGNFENALIKVRHTLYGNVVVAFGKYEQRIDRSYRHVQVFFQNNDISIRGMDD